MDRLKVRLKKSGFETEYNEDLARMLIKKGDAELVEKEVPRRGRPPKLEADAVAEPKVESKKAKKAEKSGE